MLQGVKPVPVYQGPRVAGFLPDQTAAQADTRALRDPAQIAQATNSFNRWFRRGYICNGWYRAYTPEAITSDCNKSWNN